MKPGTYARFETSMGNFTVELFDQQTPNTVANFIKLTEKNFYDGVIFHRVIDRFMIQGGDPTGTGRGDPSAAQTQLRRHPLYGQRRPEYERQPIFHYAGAHASSRRTPHRVRKGQRRHGRREEHREDQNVEARRPACRGRSDEQSDDRTSVA